MNAKKFLKNLLFFGLVMLITFYFFVELFGVPTIALLFSFPFLVIEFGAFLDEIVTAIAKEQMKHGN